MYIWRNIEKVQARHWKLLGDGKMLSGRWGSLSSGSPHLSSGTWCPLGTDPLAHFSLKQKPLTAGKGSLASQLCISLWWAPKGADLLLLLPSSGLQVCRTVLPCSGPLLPLILIFTSLQNSQLFPLSGITAVFICHGFLCLSWILRILFL